VSQYGAYGQGLKNLPGASWITLMRSDGVVLSREKLPQQVVLADCTLPIYSNGYGSGTKSYTGCSELSVWVDPINSLPGKIYISMGKSTYNVSTSTKAYKNYDYILDTSALIGTPSRWTLVGNSASYYNTITNKVVPPSSYSMFSKSPLPSLPLLYFTQDTFNKVTYVYSVTAK